MEKSPVNTRLAINLSEGTVEVEGEEAFVRYIYEDFKESLTKHMVLRPLQVQPLEHDAGERRLLASETKEPRAKAARGKSSSSDAERTRAAAAKPKFKAKLDLSGLPEFYERWKPENNSEKILVFAVFLRDKLQIAPCDADDIYTCFFTLRSETKIPEAFRQAFIDTKNRTHFIEFEELDRIEITNAGDNWFANQAKKLKESAR